MSSSSRITTSCRNGAMTLIVLLGLTTNFLPASIAFATPSPTTKRFHRSKNHISGFDLYSSSETAADTTPPPKSIILPDNKISINGATKEQASFPSQFSINFSNWLERIRQVSNFASFLCVLDCTILPIITVALPLVGVFNLGSSQLDALHQLGHALALYFVLPVGSLTTLINFLSHRKAWISSMATVGLFLVGVANSHVHIHNPHWIEQTLHLIQHGAWWHRVVNLVGCGLLLGSNYLSQQQGCAHHSHDDMVQSTSCSHSHSHDDHVHE